MQQQHTWHLRLKAVFEEARRLGGAQRDSYLQRVRGEAEDGPAVCEAVQSMLAAVAESLGAGNAAGTAPPDNPRHAPPHATEGCCVQCGAEAGCCDHSRGVGGGPWQEVPGAWVGRYKLLQKLGEGGFGVVWLAEQRSPVRRQVALKLIKLGMDTEQVIARFEAERQALALMDHPNIARVYDAGATPQGRPYFVMELVKGVPITEYCDAERLSTRDRLSLFCGVCRAVQHAHQKGVIHRDLKPTNVLVCVGDAGPTPKVIDFGIAKATQARLTERTLFTEARQFIGTPEYMSPEQADMSGLDIDTRSDVYSLGVVLYELLTGLTPFDGARLRSAALNEIQRIIRDEDPPRPSTRISQLLQHASTGANAPAATLNRRGITRADAAAAKRYVEQIARGRRTDVRHLTRELRGDLDWVVMKALEKDRTRRYDSAGALADDVERYLKVEPVVARPPSGAYRLRKLYRRKRGTVLAITAVAATLLIGFAGTSLGMVREWRARTRAESAEIRARDAMNDATAAMADAKAQAAAATAARVQADAALREAQAQARLAREQAAIAEAVNRFLNDDILAQVAPEELGREVSVRQVLDRAAARVDAEFAGQPAVRSTLRMRGLRPRRRSPAALTSHSHSPPEATTHSHEAATSL